MLRFFLYLTVFILFCIILMNAEVSAQAPDSTEDKLKSELPERVLVTIIDTTMIQLVQRERFTDSVRPKMDEYLGIYAKERPWNLPDILTPSRFVASESRALKDSLVLLTVYPSFPNALFYQGLLSGCFEYMDGLFYFNRQNLFDSRTENRGQYNVDNFRGVWGYQYRDLTDFKVDLQYDAKNLGWLRVPVTEKILFLEKTFRFSSPMLIGNSAFPKTRNPQSTLILRHFVWTVKMKLTVGWMQD
jgi:hypothetical protein